MNPKVNLEYLGNNELDVWFDGEYLGSIQNDLSEAEKLKQINDLVDQYSNAD